MNISVVIPNYNGEELLKENLPKVISVLKEYKKGKKELVIVDDTSTDGSLLFLTELEKSQQKTDVPVVLLKNEVNKGFSPTVNRGVKASHGEIVILLNSDVIPEKGFIEPLLSHFTDASVFGVGCMDRSIESGKPVLRGRGVGGWKRGFMMHRAGSLDKKNTLWVSGGSSAFKKSVWEKIGGLNELYAPYYWEDNDISYRALKAGYRLVFEKKSTVIHEHERGAIKKSKSAKHISSIAFRNQLFFTWINATDRNIILSHVIWLPLTLLRAVLRLDGAMLSGFFKAVLRLPSIISARIKTQQLFVRSDSDVMKGFSS